MAPIQYAGFRIRTLAALIDTLLLSIIIFPLLSSIYGVGLWQTLFISGGTWYTLLNYIFPALAVVIFWIYKSATPGKLWLHLKIVDERTGGKPSTPQLIGRYLGYYVSMLPFMLGIIWVGIDERKQGWHDKLANTLVVKEQPEKSQDTES